MFVLAAVFCVCSLLGCRSVNVIVKTLFDNGCDGGVTGA